MSNWFTQSEVSSKRESIALLLQKLMMEYSPENNVVLPPLEFTNNTPNKEEMRKEILGKINRKGLKRSKNKNNKNRESPKIPGICDTDSEIPGLGNGKGIPGLGGDDDSASSVSVPSFLKSTVTSSNEVSSSSDISSLSFLKTSSFCSSKNTYKVPKLGASSTSETHDIVSPLTKSVALSKVLNKENSSSLKFLAECYKNSDGSQSD